MPLLQLCQATLKYGVAPLLDQVDFQVDAGERVCLLGRNGAGKTSLMRVLAREEEPSEGEVICPPGTAFTRLPQEIPSDVVGSVEEVMRSGVRVGLHEEDWEIDVRIDELSAEMGLPLDQEFIALSGGLKRRVLLAKALLGRPDILLLDEPTNHLDLESILWLENFLVTQKLTIFFVTHDRAFLRKLATRIVELDRGKLSSWACDYDTFLIRKAAAMEAEEKQWATFDKKLAQEEAWLRQGVKARRTRNEGRVRSLEKMREERRARRNRQGTAKMDIQTGTLSGQKVIEAIDVSFDFGGKPIVRDLNTTIWRGDKIGIIGPNGGGKTTLIKLLLGRLEPQQGLVKPGTNLQIVYLDQLRGQIDDAKTVMENVAGDAEMITFRGRNQHIHGYLQDFLFTPERARMPAKRLSGGERNRLLLARLFLQPANVLVMDEPTNDLDTETLELLEELLVEFTGTLLLVSHDRAFLDNVVTSTLIFEGEGRITEYSGGYADWMKQKELTATRTSVTTSLPVKETAPAISKEEPRKFLKREEKELAELPAQIEKLEFKQAILTTQLAEPALYAGPKEKVTELQTALADLEKQTQTAYARWKALEELRDSCVVAD